MAKVHSLGFRNPQIVTIDKAISNSGKYLIFYGIHYIKGKPCYDVGSCNKENGEVVRRHYNEDNNIAPEASAKTFWSDFKEKMLAKLKMPGEPGELEQINEWLNINDPNSGGIKRVRKPN